MHDNEASPRDSARDLADPTHARRSLRASLDRRLRRARRRRMAGGSRRAAIAATCLLAVGAAGATAHESGGVRAKSGKAKAASTSAGVDVAAVQRKLGVTADGVIGPQTRRAIRRFQKRNGLKADGILGPATLGALGVSADAGAGAGDAAGGDEGDGGGPSAAAPSSDMAARLERIAQCESGGDPTAVSPDGRYRGKYQFARETWESLGGEGDPADAPEAEQDLRAAALMERQGPSAWPVCSKQ